MAVNATASILLVGGSSLLSLGIGYNYSTGGQLVGKRFVDMVKETPYKDVLTVNATYEVYIIKKAQLHRLLLVKLKGSLYPWITFEINTPNLTDLTTVMQEKEDLPWNSENVGNYVGNLLGICAIADSVIKRMENYRLFSSNCQHFCNNLLIELGLETYETTIGPRTTLEPEFNQWPGPDTHFTARGLDHAYSSAIGFAPGIVARATAAIVGLVIGAPSTLNVATTH